MADGVMALDFKGRVIMFNSAAGHILGFEPEDVLGKTFAALFMLSSEDNDQFNQVILDAVYQQAVGLSSTVEFSRMDGSKVILSVNSSYLQGDNPEAGHKGVILVFSDITELKRLQARQEEDARKLGKAYQELEEKTGMLEKALKRVQVIKIFSFIAIIILFAGISLYYFQGDSLLDRAVSPESEPPAEGTEAINSAMVTSRPLSSSVSLSGTLKPLEEIVVTAPFDARIEDKFFSFGQVVNKGDVLILLDSSDLEIKLRQARSDFIKANQRYQELIDWDSGTEMTRARRGLTRARDTVQVNQSKLEEARLLFDKGVIPAHDVESAERQLKNAREDLQNAREELESVRKKADERNIELARMELKNARVNLENLEHQLKDKEIRAPVSGVVIQPVTKDDQKVSLEKGARISAGDTLLAVGNLNGMTVSTKVDEVDVRKISKGQPVEARGDAFPDITLNGEVSHISAQAEAGSGRQGSTFDVIVTFPEMDDESLEQIRVGMSADLEIIVYKNDNALMAPISHVRMIDGQPRVRLVKSNGEIVTREVETGITTMNAVEIKSGLEPGDKLAGW